MSRWWDEAVIYEIYPRSFQDSDGDGIGDLRGIEERLEYLAWLGVDAIWLAPIYSSPLADLGYDVADHRSIAPELGSDDDFRRLVDRAHGLDIRVLVDLVASHTSIEHPWFRTHPERYVWAESLPNNWVASFGGPAWSLDPESGLYYLHSFFAEQPDLDWRNPDVREAMGAVVGHWLDRGVDGFRVDAVDRLMKDEALRDDPIGERPFPLPVHPEGQNLDPTHSRDDPGIGGALSSLREAAGDALLVGEVYLPGDRLDSYRPFFDRLFAFDLLHSEWDAAAIATVLQREGSVPELAWVISNHDFSRPASRWGEDSVRVAAMLLLTLPGCAFVYQGEEIGMVDGPGGSPPLDRFGRDAFRHPMQWEATPGGGFTDGDPWLPLTDPVARNVADQQSDPESTLSLFRLLIEARRDLEGPLVGIGYEGQVLSYRRGNRFAVALNLGPDLEPNPLPPEAEVLVSTAGERADPTGLRPGEGLLVRRPEGG